MVIQEQIIRAFVRLTILNVLQLPWLFLNITLVKQMGNNYSIDEQQQQNILSLEHN